MDARLIVINKNVNIANGSARRMTTPQKNPRVMSLEPPEKHTAHAWESEGRTNPNKNEIRNDVGRRRIEFWERKARGALT